MDGQRPYSSPLQSMGVGFRGASETSTTLFESSNFSILLQIPCNRIQIGTPMLLSPLSTVKMMNVFNVQSRDSSIGILHGPEPFYHFSQPFSEESR